MKKVFEKWIIKKMGNHVKQLLIDFDEEDGYADQTVNAMWIGFNAGVKLYPLIED